MWIAYYRRSPFGAEAEACRIGYAACRLANVLCKGFGLRGATFKPSDFMPRVKKERQRQSDDEIAAVFRKAALAAHQAKYGRPFDG